MENSGLAYVVGDATFPIGEGPKVIAHIVNDVGAWGAGFVLSLSKRWPQVERQYSHWADGQTKEPFSLGSVQFVTVSPTLTVANMLAQHTIDGPRPRVQYPKLALCLRKVFTYADQAKASVHGPRFGAGLAGGDWTIIEDMVKRELVERGVSVTIYDLFR